MRLRKIQVVILIAAFMGLFSFCQSASANVYMNSVPSDITINEGDPLDIPLFIDAGANTGKPCELYIWAETLDGQTKAFLGPTLTWSGFTSYSQMQPVVKIDQMVEYVNLQWQPFADTTGLPSMRFTICLDGNEDGHLSNGPNTTGATCGTRVVTIVPRPCTGLRVLDSKGNDVTSISQNVDSGGTCSAMTYSVVDSCNKPISYDVSTTNSWIKLDKATGQLTVTFQATSLGTGDYVGNITASAGGTTKQIGASLTVNSTSSGTTGGSGGSTNCAGLSGIFLTLCQMSSGSGSSGGSTGGSGGSGSGGGGGCTPTSFAFIPGIDLDGTTTTKSVSITNNCGSAFTGFTATASSSGWLSVSQNGNTITANASIGQLTGGTYSGQITLSASGYSSMQVPVTLTISGPCVPSKVVLNPSAISQSISVGGTIANIPVTAADNCGTAFGVQIGAVTNTTLITSPASQSSYANGQFTVSLNTSSLPVGTYAGDIPVTAIPPAGYTGGVSQTSPTLHVSVDVTATANDGSLPRCNDTNGGQLFQLGNGSQNYFTMPSGGACYFKILATAPTGVNPVTVFLDNADQTIGSDSDLIVKYAGANCELGAPTMADWQAAKASVTPMWDSIAGAWNPAAFAPNFYYTIQKGGSNEYVRAWGNPNPHGCFYLMVVNNYNTENTLVLRPSW